jgi:TRAP-type uncharacterized transport system fused permease subunit
MAFGWTIFVIPFVFVYSGTLLMKGDPLFIVLDTATAVAGVWFISAAVMGFSLRPLKLLDRLIYGIAGIFLLLPVGAFAEARWFNVAGAVIAVAIVAWEWFNRRMAKAPVGGLAPAEASASASAGAPIATGQQRAFLDRMGVRGTGEGE